MSLVAVQFRFDACRWSTRSIGNNFGGTCDVITLFALTERLMRAGLMLVIMARVRLQRMETKELAEERHQ